MQDIEPDAIVNRGKPIPVIETSTSKDGQNASSPDWRQKASSSGMSTIQERAFNAILSQMFPSAEHFDAKSDKKPKKDSSRPDFSLPIMGDNFRRFNARIGVVFAFQANVESLLAWEQPVNTLALLAVYTLICLNPRLLLVLPMVICLLFIMVPAYLARHPPPSDSAVTEIFDITGPPLAAPSSIKPAPELSRDFLRNMRDLQNSMADFSVIHDLIVANVTPLTNFSDEKLSSTLFLGLFAVCCTLFVGAELVPLRAAALLLGWLAICSGHPLFKALTATIDHDKMSLRQTELKKNFNAWIASDILLDVEPEVREVEVFEIQHQTEKGGWEPWLYSSLPHTPLSPARINGERPVGAPFFEDVKPPKGWEWKSKKWDLDLMSRDWVEERMITAVEVETAGERWVYDLTADSVVQPGTAKKKSVKLPKQGWEEVSNDQEKGEWRRRRWVRLVRRRIFKEDTS